MDLRKEESVQAAFDETISEVWKLLDILVNNASAIHIEPSETIDMKRYDLAHSDQRSRHFFSYEIGYPVLEGRRQFA